MILLPTIAVLAAFLFILFTLRAIRIYTMGYQHYVSRLVERHRIPAKAARNIMVYRYYIFIGAALSCLGVAVYLFYTIFKIVRP